MDEDLGRDSADRANGQDAPSPVHLGQRDLTEDVQFAPERALPPTEDRLPVPEALENTVDAHGIACPDCIVECTSLEAYWWKLANKISTHSMFESNIKRKHSIGDSMFCLVVDNLPPCMADPHALDQ
jgi:hypothetical protein